MGCGFVGAKRRPLYTFWRKNKSGSKGSLSDLQWHSLVCAATYVAVIILKKSLPAILDSVKLLVRLSSLHCTELRLQGVLLLLFFFFFSFSFHFNYGKSSRFVGGKTGFYFGRKKKRAAVSSIHALDNFTHRLMF